MTRNLDKFKEVYLQELEKINTLGKTEELKLHYRQNCIGIKVAASHILSKAEYQLFECWIHERD